MTREDDPRVLALVVALAAALYLLTWWVEGPPVAIEMPGPEQPAAKMLGARVSPG